jgi:hypothetical protein
MIDESTLDVRAQDADHQSTRDRRADRSGEVAE